MRRILEVVSLALVVAGFELTAGTVSHTFQVVRRVYRELVWSTEPTVSLPRVVLGGLLVVAGLAGLALALWARVRGRKVGWGKTCPQCGSATHRIRRRRRHRILGWLLGRRITRRRCRECGWRGLTVSESA